MACYNPVSNASAPLKSNKNVCVIPVEAKYFFDCTKKQTNKLTWVWRQTMLYFSFVDVDVGRSITAPGSVALRQKLVWTTLNNRTNLENSRMWRECIFILWRNNKSLHSHTGCWTELLYVQSQFNYKNGNISRSPEVLLIYYSCNSVSLLLSWEIWRGGMDQESSQPSGCFQTASFQCFVPSKNYVR